MTLNKIIINKNRGWRGLAEIIVKDGKDTVVAKHIFSFSQEVWNDLMDGRVVIQDDTEYYVLEINNVIALPRGHQRSVLIKNFNADVINVNRYEKKEWSSANGNDWNAIYHYMKNKNNHTTSDWNCIGLRVIPEI